MGSIVRKCHATQWEERGPRKLWKLVMQKVRGEEWGRSWNAHTILLRYPFCSSHTLNTPLLSARYSAQKETRMYVLLSTCE